MHSAIITNIQRFSIHDGPGIRTTVFLKGCNLNCAWCHNPECISKKPQIQVFKDKCIDCLSCVKACSRRALKKSDGGIAIDRARCAVCGECAKACPSGGVAVCGQLKTSSEVICETLKDKDFYDASGGGITLSGGEPLLNAAFCAEVMAGCKEKGMSTAAETALYAPFEEIKKVIPVCDLFIVDIKVSGDRKENDLNGCAGRIQSNFKRLAGQGGVRIHVRTPVIPGVNDSVEELKKIREFATSFDAVIGYELIQFHSLGKAKYQSLGLPYPDFKPYDAGHFEELKRKVLL